MTCRIQYQDTKISLILLFSSHCQGNTDPGFFVQSYVRKTVNIIEVILEILHVIKI